MNELDKNQNFSQNKSNNDINSFFENLNKNFDALEKANEKYYKLLNEKEELSYEILEQDNSLFLLKRELDELNNLKSDQLQKQKDLEEKMNGKENTYLENLLINPILQCEFYDNQNDSLTKTTFSNGINMIFSSNSLNESKVVKFIMDKKSPSMDNIDTLYKENPDLAILYLANSI